MGVYTLTTLNWYLQLMRITLVPQGHFNILTFVSHSHPCVPEETR